MNKASNGMNNPQNKESMLARERRMLPFFVEFVKFSTGFAVIIAAALLTLHVASAAMD
ncbi:MAG: hypothetical protein AAB794_04230 [Patescibacteria group bacterium]